MSNRTIEQANALAELKVAHEMQIETLTAPRGLWAQRVSKFMIAAGADVNIIEDYIASRPQYKEYYTAAYTVWTMGKLPKSLFAYLPYCGCPVQEHGWGLTAREPLIPPRDRVTPNWNPDRATLEAFARVQQAAFVETTDALVQRLTLRPRCRPISGTLHVYAGGQTAGWMG